MLLCAVGQGNSFYYQSQISLLRSPESCPRPCSVSTFLFAWEERFQLQSIDAMKCLCFLLQSMGPECLLGSKQFSVSYSYFPMLRERPLMILAPGNKDCFLNSKKKKKKAPYKIWTNSGKAMMFEVNIIQAFLKLRDLGYPPVALLRIIIGSVSLLSVWEENLPFEEMWHTRS